MTNMSTKEIGESSHSGSCAPALHAVIDQYINGTELADLVEEHGVFVSKHLNTIMRVADSARYKKQKGINKTRMEVAELKTWQHALLRILDGPVHDRHVFWFCDEVGGSGKTYFAKYLVAMRDTFSVSNAKTADILYAYGGQKIVIIDLTRAQLERINFDVIEMLKNGMFLSTKYVSQQKLYDPPHVVIFANQMPDRSKLSEDRWRIFKREEDEFYEQLPRNTFDVMTRKQPVSLLTVDALDPQANIYEFRRLLKEK